MACDWRTWLRGKPRRSKLSRGSRDADGQRSLVVRKIRIGGAEFDELTDNRVRARGIGGEERLCTPVESWFCVGIRTAEDSVTGALQAFSTDEVNPARNRYLHPKMRYAGAGVVHRHSDAEGRFRHDRRGLDAKGNFEVRRRCEMSGRRRAQSTGEHDS
jgi:hypothetical protein